MVREIPRTLPRTLAIHSREVGFGVWEVVVVDVVVGVVVVLVMGVDDVDDDVAVMTRMGPFGFRRMIWKETARMGIMRVA